MTIRQLGIRTAASNFAQFDRFDDFLFFYIGWIRTDLGSKFKKIAYKTELN